MIKKILGIDVGGTKIHAAVYEPRSWTMLEEIRVETDAHKGMKAVLDQVCGIIDDFEEVDCIGLGLPGYIDSELGVIYRTPNIVMPEPINVYHYFKGKNLVADNDANLFTLAEFEMNWKSEGVKNMLGLTIGTGLGGGIVINGDLYRGRDGFAAELGHMIYDENSDFEDHVSGKGDEELWGKYLGLAISNLIHIFNPEVIMLGGSISRKFSAFERDMWAEIKKRNILESCERLIIERSKLENPATLGAALLAFKNFKNA